jgi:hemin uptake protein HemP
MAQKFLTGVQLTDGSAGSPALSFSSDTNTGIYWNTYSGDAKQLNIATDGVVRASFNSAGITSYANIYSGPSGQFRNYAGVWKATTGTTGNGFEFSSADQTGAMTLTSNGNLKVHNNIRSQGHSTTGLSGKGMELRFFTDTDVGSILSYDRSNSTYLPIGVFGSTVSLQTNGTERLHITNAGNVGIGVTPASIGQKLRVNGNIKVGDSQKFLAGVDNDLQIYHSGTDSFINNDTGDLIIKNFANDRDIIFQSDNGSGGIATYFYLDGSNSHTNFQLNARWVDNAKAEFGNSGDLDIYHDGSTSYIINQTGNFDITNSSNDAELRFRCDNGSGGNATYFFLDGSRADGTYLYTEFPDNSIIGLGNDTDLQMYHNSTNSVIDNYTGDLAFQQKADDKDIVFKCDDGSGGITEYFKLQGSNERLVVAAPNGMKFNDSIQAKFGNGSDLQIYHDSTNSVINNVTGNLQIYNNANDGDIQFISDDGTGGTTEYFRVDGGITKTVFVRDTKHLDSQKGLFGTNDDLRILHDGSDSFINSNGAGNLYIQQFNDDKDIIFKCDDGSGSVTEYFRLDGSSGYNIFSKDLYFIDNVTLRIGTGQDLRIYHNATNNFIEGYTGNLIIQNHNDDGDIIFKSDDGSGGTTEYFRLDGSEVRTRFFQNAIFGDNVKAQFGTGGDLEIYHDGSDSYIHDNGTGDLRVRTNRFVLNNAADTENLIRAEQNSSVELFYNNSKKLETTNTGVSITGDLTVSGTTTTVNQTNLDVSDNIIGLNRGASTNANDSGLIIERGTTGDNAAFLWDESEDKFVFGLTTATPSATGNVSLSGYSGIKTGSITASSDITTSGSVFADTHFRSTDGNATLSATGGGGVYLRPNGYGSTTGQVVITASNGDATFNGGIKVNQSATIHGTDNQIASIYMNAGGYGLSGKFGSYARNLIRSNGTNTIQIGDNTSLISLIQLKAGSSSVDGVIQLSTKNTERMRITHDGKVGVNTSSPGAKLHVVESTTNTQALRVDDGTSFVSVVPSLGSGGYTGISTAGDIGLIFSIDGDNTTDTTNGLLIAPHTNTSGGLKILENGNVGIGVATPGARLQVNGSTSDGTANAFIARNSSATSLFSIRNDGRIDVPSGAIVHSGGGYANTSTNDSYFTGDLGIGTTSPAVKLHVEGGNSYTPIRFDGFGNYQGYLYNDGGGIGLKDSSGTNIGNLLYIHTAGNNIRLYTNGSERIRFDSSGKVGIGTTSPQTNTKLEVSGALKAGNKTSWSDRDGAALTTTGRVVAGLTGNANGNGASALYIFTCYGGNGYQRIVYSCRNQSGTWVVNKDIDEGVDAFDVVASTPSSGSAVTFTFKARTSNQSYTASVFIEHMGHNLDTQYVG